MEKVGTQAVQEPRIRAEKPETGGRAVTLDGETVNSGSATRIWDGQPGAQADVIGDASGGMGKPGEEPGVQ